MQYDPIKRILGKFFNRQPWMRVLFYRLLDLLLLRSWHIRKELRKWAKTLNQREVNVLDAGFGYGQYSWFLSGLGKNISVKGLEIKQEQVDDCNSFFQKKGRTKVGFFTGDLTQYVDDQAYDLILCVDVMEHILEDTLVFSNYARSLRKGGILLVSTPSDQGGSDVHDHDDSSFIEEHVRDGYGKEEIAQKLSDAGFSSSEVKYSYGTFGKISWRLSMKFPIQFVNASRLFFILLPFYYIITFPFCLIFNGIDVNSTNKTGTGLIVRAIK